MPGSIVAVDDRSSLIEAINRIKYRDAGNTRYPALVIWTASGSTYPLTLAGTSTNHLAVLLGATSPTATPSTSNAVVLIQDAALSIGAGKEVRLYNAAGSNLVNLIHSGTSDILKSDDGLWIAGAIGAGVTPSGLSAGDILAAANLMFKSSTANIMTFDHAASSARTWTFQDATDTVVGRATTDTLTNKTVTAVVTTGTITANAGTGTATQVLHGGATPTWGALVKADITAGATTLVIAETVVSGSSVASVVLSSIPATYRHLTVRIQVRGTTAATATALLVRFNADTGANYDYQWVAGAAAVASAAEGLAQTAVITGFVTAATAAAGISSQVNIHIANYAGTTFEKTMTADTATKGGTASGNLTSYRSAGFWRNTAAITSITVLPFAGNLDIGTVVTLYGEPT